MTTQFTLQIRRNRFPELERLDFTQSFARIASYFSAELSGMFETEGASRGHPWAPLSRTYAEQKAAEGRSAKILHYTGLLRSTHATLRVTKTSLVYGWPPGFKRAVYHDKGTRRMPTRPLIRIIPRDLMVITSKFTSQIEATAGGQA